jgi:hypothetical protein
MKLFLLCVAILLTVAVVHTSDANSYIVTTNDGAILREKPSINSKKLDKLNYGTSITVSAVLPKADKISISGYELEGNWLEVKWQGNLAYIFAPLVELASINEFPCSSKGPKYNLVLWLPDHSVTLCQDGSYMLDDSYGNALNSSEHGCYRIGPNGLEIARRKSFSAVGVGKKLQCTHFCTYSAYRIESRKHEDPYRTQGIEDFQHFTNVYKGQDNPAEANFSIRKHNSPKECKRSSLFHRR